MSTRMTAAEMCAACAAGGTQRYCAPGRCYCAHDACHADWHPLPALSDTPATTAPPSSSWDNREESTWIDQL